VGGILHPTVLSRHPLRAGATATRFRARLAL